MNENNGVILIDKPKGETSFQQIIKLRKKLNIKKIGHCGTLDPLATGLLVICIGKATKLVEMFSSNDKEYIAEISFGNSTTTDDLEGEILKKSEKKINENELLSLINNFIGEIEQTPPNFSAIKVNGKRAYKLARFNEKFEISKRKIIINEINLIYFDELKQLAKLNISCSKGTYIRSIARDLGEISGCYAHLSSLVRVRSGNFSIFSQNLIEDLNKANKEEIVDKMMSISDALGNIKCLFLKDNTEKKIKYGQPISEDDIDWKKSNMENKFLHIEDLLKINDTHNNTIAIVDNKLSYLKVFV